MKHTAVLYRPDQARAAMSALWAAIKPELADGKRLVVEVKPETRSLDQNAKLWACLTDISEQVEWHGMKPSPEDWKNIFTSALKRHRVVPGIDGGFVVLGASTSKMTKGELSDLLELIAAFGAEHGVVFKEQA